MGKLLVPVAVVGFAFLVGWSGVAGPWLVHAIAWCAQHAGLHLPTLS